jgi:Txe/YoeB family toxin of Txe-Axe toxin-antitoxin module
MMEKTVTSQFIILSLHPAKGRIIINNIHFRYSLTGAVLMDFLNNGEITLDRNRLIARMRKNGDPVHDKFADFFEKSSKPKRLSYWVRRLTRESRLVFRENINTLINSGLIKHERRYFLNIIPYNRYFLSGGNLRIGIINELREILLRDKQATRVQRMLIGLIKASRSSRILAIERGERSTLRKKCNSFSQNDPISTEIEKVISQVQAAIIASITAASTAASSSH